MPLLNTIGAASIRSYGRGRGGGGAAAILDTKINATMGSSVALGGTLSQYFSAMNIGSTATALKTQGEFTRVGNGILSFTIPAGTYNWSARSADGSGTGHWTGFAASGVMTFSADTDVMLLVPNNGNGSYSGAGGLFLVTGTNYASPTGVVLVMGGGGGGYFQNPSGGAPGGFTSNTTTASNRRSTSSDRVYDGGGGVFNTYVVEGIGSGAGVAQHFVQGGSGGVLTNCGTFGGFGGGGGSCPGAGGGYVGGYPGGNSPYYYGGGGGTSYYNPTWIGSFPSITTNSSNTSSNISGLQAASSGNFRIWS